MNQPFQPKTPARLTTHSVDIPYPPSYLSSHARRPIMEQIQILQALEKEAQKPDWADPRDRMLFVYKKRKADLIESISSLKKAVHQTSSDPTKNLVESNVRNIEQTLASFEKKIVELEESLKQRHPLPPQRRQKKEALYELIRNIEKQLQELKTAREAWNQARQTRVMLSDKIDRLREQDMDVLDLMIQLRQAMKRGE